MKKGQLSIFIIVGIVILFIILAGILLINKLNEDKVTEGLVSSTEISSDLKPVVNYLEECISTVANDGMLLLGEQSGLIYYSQGGIADEPVGSSYGIHFINYTSRHNPRRVWYNIRRNGPRPAICEAKPPDYPVRINIPYPYLLTTDFASSFSSSSYLLNKNYESYFCFGSISFFDYEYSLENLREYVKNNIEKSCDLSAFKNYNYEVGKIDVDVQDREGSTRVGVIYPIKITNIQTGAKSELKEFRVNIKISLRQVYLVLNDILQKEVSDATYLIQQEYENYRIFSEKDKYKNDDVIIIKNPKLRLGSDEFIFVFARQNRYPVLEYVYNTSFSKLGISSSKIELKDIIKQELAAVDPDEDDVEIKVYVNGYVNNVKQRVEITKDKPYTVSSEDMISGRLEFNITATDGALSDYQVKNYYEQFVIT